MVNLVAILVTSLCCAVYVLQGDYSRANFYLLLVIFNLATMIYFK